jgi:hypothetical protein
MRGQETFGMRLGRRSYRQLIDQCNKAVPPWQQPRFGLSLACRWTGRLVADERSSSKSISAGYDNEI